MSAANVSTVAANVAFNALDTNKDGVISQTELQAALTVAPTASVTVPVQMPSVSVLPATSTVTYAAATQPAAMPIWSYAAPSAPMTYEVAPPVYVDAPTASVSAPAAQTSAAPTWRYAAPAVVYPTIYKNAEQAVAPMATTSMMPAFQQAYEIAPPVYIEAQPATAPAEASVVAPVAAPVTYLQSAPSMLVYPSQFSYPMIPVNPVVNSSSPVVEAEEHAPKKSSNKASKHASTKKKGCC